MSNAKSTTSSSRIFNKLQSLLEAEKFYEAHQLYRTLHFRLSNAQKFTQLRQVLYEGANIFLEKNQVTSGADLANLYLEVVSKDSDLKSRMNNEEDKRQLVEEIGSLFSQIPAKSQERLSFTTKALKLKEYPIPLIHRKLALILWKEKNFPESRFHFVHSNDFGNDCAQMLVEYQVTYGFPSEVDLFIAQFVFQVLCIKKNKDLVNQTFHNYTAQHPSIKRCDPPFLMPLLNFLWFLLVAIKT